MSYPVDSGDDQREVQIHSEAHRCTFYTCFKDTLKFETACYVNSSNFSCENSKPFLYTTSSQHMHIFFKAIDSAPPLPSPSPALENTKSVLVLNISETNTQLLQTLGQRTVFSSTTTPAASLLPTNPTIVEFSTSSASSELNPFYQFIIDYLIIHSCITTCVDWICATASCGDIYNLSETTPPFTIQTTLTNIIPKPTGKPFLQNKLTIKV